MEVGDTVMYVPPVHHALHKDVNGHRPWVLGIREMRVQNGKQTPVVRELQNTKEEDEVLEMIHRAPDRERAKQDLVLIRPRVKWPAVVTGVNFDGTVNLDVQGQLSGVTLHEKNVRIDEAGKHGHTCCSVREEEPASENA